MTMQECYKACLLYTSETEIYFAINPKRPDIKEALDSAMRRIKDDNPFYTDDLYRRYLSAQSSSFLSKEESEWIGQDVYKRQLEIQNNDQTIKLTLKSGLQKPYLYKSKAYKRNDTATIEVDTLEFSRLVSVSYTHLNESTKYFR